MAGTAQQYAPKKNMPQTESRSEKAAASGMKEKLRAMPLWAGIAAMILLLALSLPVGNFRALQSAAPKDFIRQGAVQSILEDRAAQAGNVVTVANRAGLDAQLILDVTNAVNALEAAKTAREISRADQLLTAAVSELTGAQLSGEDAKNMLRAADNFAEQGSFLRQEAREFNKKAEKAKKLYESLPTKALFAEPDVYEGI
ncbi:MAG: hypothetical protein IKV90_10200 [Clostridia bacterium]|nr:hypothetical protein [Clostridia bacterium]